jgi:uncharacterized protein (DUF2236 family)
MFGEDAVIRWVAAEPALIAGGGRALLLQLAHPQVAQGVADHSDFANDPLPRLAGTLDFLTFVVWGTPEEAQRAAGTVRHIHEHVIGPGYSAGDPALQNWVNATLTETALDLYTRLFGRLPEAVAERYYQDATQVAAILGCPREAQPADLTAFRAYFAEMVAALEVTDTARRLARAVLEARRLPAYLKPGLPLNRFVTAGLLPAPIRRQYGLVWSPGRERSLAALLRATGAGSHLVPGSVRRRAPDLFVRLARRRAGPRAVTRKAWPEAGERSRRAGSEPVVRRSRGEA